jgi:hypothetical protein
VRKKKGENGSKVSVLSKCTGKNRKTGEKQEHGRKDSVLRKVSGGK